MADFDYRNATTIELMREIMRLTSLDEYEKRNKALRPLSANVNVTNIAEGMASRHVGNLNKIDLYLDRLQQIYEIKFNKVKRALRAPEKVKRINVKKCPTYQYYIRALSQRSNTGNVGAGAESTLPPPQVGEEMATQTEPMPVDDTSIKVEQ